MWVALPCVKLCTHASIDYNKRLSIESVAIDVSSQRVLDVYSALIVPSYMWDFVSSSFMMFYLSLVFVTFLFINRHIDTDTLHWWYMYFCKVIFSSRSSTGSCIYRPFFDFAFHDRKRRDELSVFVFPDSHKNIKVRIWSVVPYVFLFITM